MLQSCSHTCDLHTDSLLSRCHEQHAKQRERPCMKQSTNLMLASLRLACVACC